MFVTNTQKNYVTLIHPMEPLLLLPYSLESPFGKWDVKEEEVKCQPNDKSSYTHYTLPKSTATVSEGCAPTDNQYLMRSKEINYGVLQSTCI